MIVGVVGVGAVFDEDSGFVCLVGFIAVHGAVFESGKSDKKSAHRHEDDERDGSDCSGVRHWKYLLSGFAKDFGFDVVVKVVGGITVAVEADVLGFDAFEVHEFALVTFDVLFVFTSTEFGGVVVVVVKDRLNAFGEFSVFGHFDDNVEVYAVAFMEVPECESIEFAGGTEVDLNPLEARAESEEALLFVALVTVYEHSESSKFRFFGAGRDRFSCGDVGGASGDFKGRAWFVVGFFEIVAEVVEGGTTEIGIGHLDFEFIGLSESGEGNGGSQRDRDYFFHVILLWLMVDTAIGVVESELCVFQVQYPSTERG